METHFTLEQLRDPKLHEVDAILRRCIHCGFCTATCPTYLLLGDERDSPRGRITLIKSMMEGQATPKEVRPHLDRCLSCFSCMTTCPSGVDYMHLSDYARQAIEKDVPRAPGDEFLRKVLRAILPYPKRFRAALHGARAARFLTPIVRRAGFERLSAMLELAPRRLPRSGEFTQPQISKTASSRRGRVALMMGCAQRVLRPAINDASVRFLNRIGYDVELVAGEGCCGALVQHMGKETEAKAFARANMDAWHSARSRGPLDAIIMNASGCGTTVKDYGHMFAQDPAYAQKAKFMSSLAKDITEFAAAQRLDPPVMWSDIRVAYHSACSMQHAQQLDKPPRDLLRKAGFTVTEIPEGHICCGSAGTYNILQPQLASQLQTRKLDAIAKVKADCVATGNIGCLTQLSAGPVPVVHSVELLDWAYGGSCPEELRHLENRITKAPKAAGRAAAGTSL